MCELCELRDQQRRERRQRWGTRALIVFVVVVPVAAVILLCLASDIPPIFVSAPASGVVLPSGLCLVSAPWKYGDRDVPAGRAIPAQVSSSAVDCVQPGRPGLESLWARGGGDVTPQDDQVLGPGVASMGSVAAGRRPGVDVPGRHVHIEIDHGG